MIPRFTGFQDKARATQALTDAKQIATAIDSIQIETNAWPQNDTDDAKVLDLAGLTLTEGETKGNGSWTSAPSAEKDGGFQWTVTVGDTDYTAGREGTGPVKLIEEAG